MARAATTTDTFNAIGEPQRRRILEVLAIGEAPVGDIVDAVGLTQPQVSKHLKVLRSVDLVRCRAEGRRRMYRVNEPALEPVHAWLRSFTSLWNERFDRLEAVLTDLTPDPEQKDN